MAIRKRRCRLAGGRYTGSKLARLEGELVAADEHTENELELLADGGITAEERAQLEAFLPESHRQSLGYLRGALRAARPEA